MRKIYAILFLILSLAASQAQRRGLNFTFDHYAIKNGLSDGRVDCILQDSNGFLWFGTQDGLNRFDGHNFTVFGHDMFDSTSLSSDWIRCLLEDRYQQLWIGTEGGGLNRYDYQTGTFTSWLQTVGEPSSLSDNFVRALYEDKSGTLWIGTRSGLVSFDRRNESFMPFYRNPENPASAVFDENITEIMEDADQNLWIGTSNDIYRIDKERRMIEHFPSAVSSERITSILQDSYGDIWFGSRYSGIKRFNPDSRTFTRIQHNPENPRSLSSNEIKDIFEDSNENLWVATMHGGLNLFNRKTRSFRQFQHNPDDPSSLSSNSVRSLYQDRNGVLWMGMDGSGIDHYYKNKEKFEFYTLSFRDRKESINSTVLSIAEDTRGRLWIGTEGSGLIQFSRSRNIVSQYKYQKDNPYSISSNQVTSILEDDEGVLWVGTKEGLCKFFFEKEFFHRYYVRTTPITGNNFINAIDLDSKGNLWLGTNGGLIRFDKESNNFTAVDFDTSGVLNDEAIVSLFIDPAGIFWIGYLRSGLVALQPHAGLYRHYRSDPGSMNSLSSNFVQYIYSDNHNRLWIATRKGLNRYDSEKDGFTRYSKADGLPSNVIAGIAEDHNGNIWLSTTNGISKFNVEERTFTNYTVEDGLQGNQFWNRSCFQSRAGELFFGGNNGFNAFYPGQIDKMANPQIPPIVITNISVLNKPLSESIYPYLIGGDTLKLPYRNNQISLEFAALDYIRPEKNQFAYKLEGFENEWNYAGTRRYANYTNLDPGYYTFKVKGTNSDGVWNEEGAALSIYIPTPFGRTYWAYLLYGILFIGLVYAINAYIIGLVRVKHDLKIERMERKKAKEMNQFKLQFFTDIAHEFKTPLTLIQAPLEEILSSIKEKGPHRQELNLMYRNVRYLMRLVQQLLCFRRIEHGSMALKVSAGDLVAFSRRVFDLFAENARKHKIDYQFITESDSITGWFDWVKIEEILVNLIDNALKYTPDRGTVWVKLFTKTVSTGHQVAVIKVMDSGIGISKDQIPHIFERFYHNRDEHDKKEASSGLGLALTKKLVEMHSGTIRVESEADQGSCFIIALPLGKDHFSTDQVMTQAVEPSYLQNQNILENESLLSEEPSIVPSENTESDRTLILLVEDNGELRSYLKKSLSKKYAVAEARDGEEGSKIALDLMPHLIISDVLMPRKDGLELCAELKQQSATSHIPIILLTARNDVESKIKGIEYGADDYIEKPFHFRFLEARIINLLKSRQTLRERYRNELIMEPEKVKAFSHDEKLLLQIRNFVEEHLAEPELGVNHLTSQLGLSRTMLFVKLKALIGYSPQEYIRVLRLKKAAQMLLRTDYTISEIAYQVGFKYPKYFSTCFQQEYGKTPSEYREDTREHIK